MDKEKLRKCENGDLVLLDENGNALFATDKEGYAIDRTSVVLDGCKGANRNDKVRFWKAMAMGLHTITKESIDESLKELRGKYEEHKELLERNAEELREINKMQEQLIQELKKTHSMDSTLLKVQASQIESLKERLGNHGFSIFGIRISW